jgi:hypothetical protein
VSRSQMGRERAIWAPSWSCPGGCSPSDALLEEVVGDPVVPDANGTRRATHNARSHGG